MEAAWKTNNTRRNNEPELLFSAPLVILNAFHVICLDTRNPGIRTSYRRCRTRPADPAGRPAAGIHSQGHAAQRLRRRKTPASDPVHGGGAYDRGHASGRSRRAGIGAGDAAYIFVDP